MQLEQINATENETQKDKYHIFSQRWAENKFKYVCALICVFVGHNTRQETWERRKSLRKVGQQSRSRILNKLIEQNLKVINYLQVIQLYSPLKQMLRTFMRVQKYLAPIKIKLNVIKIIFKVSNLSGWWHTPFNLSKWTSVSSNTA